MHDHHLTVGGEVDVQLNDVGTGLIGVQGALHGVLGGGGGKAAVTDVQGGAGHGVFGEPVAGDVQKGIGGIRDDADGT